MGEAVSNVVPIHRKKLAAGYVFLERYRLIRRLGRGGMGEVWLAADERVNDRVVALKLLKPDALRVEGAVERFLRETRALTQLQQPNVVRLYDAGAYPQPFMVMEAVQGVTLRQMLREGGPLPWRAAVCYAIQVRSVRQAGLWPAAGVVPRARVPRAGGPAELVPAAASPALARPTRDLRSVGRVAIRSGIALVAAVALVITARALGVRVEVSAAPVVRAAPVISATAAPLPSSAPSLSAMASASQQASVTAPTAIAPASAKPSVDRLPLPSKPTF